MVTHKVANTDDVQFDSGKRGYGGPLHGSKPDELTPVTGGDGGVDFVNQGMSVSAPSSGDSASVKGFNSNRLRGMTHTLRFVFGPSTSPSNINNFKIGYIQDGYRSCYLDLNSNEFVFSDPTGSGGKTSSAHEISKFTAANLTIIWSGYECQYLLESDGKKSSATLSVGTPVQTDTLIKTENNGGSPAVYFEWVSHTFGGF